jgi:menaquinone-9 beta-reductase
MEYDVIVVGAGVAGAASAWFASRQGLQVALLDKAKFPRDKVCTSTVNPRSCSYLQELGVLQDLAPHHLHAIPGIQGFAYDNGTFRGFYEPSAPYLNYGHTIPRYLLDAALVDKVVSASGVEFIDDFAVEDVVTDGSESPVVVRGRRGNSTLSLHGTMVIDAAGRNSPICRKHNIHEPWTDHRRFAVIAQFSGVAWGETLFTIGTNYAVGPGYYCVFPIAGDTAIVSLILPEPQWEEARKDLPNSLREFVKSDWYLRDWFKRARQETDTVGFGPLAFRARQISLDRILMVGDTTGFYDPITGEGITFAFRSAELAAKAAKEISEGAPWEPIARAYEKTALKEKQEGLDQSLQLQRMLKRPEAFNRFVKALDHNPLAANWLACGFGNLLPEGNRSTAHLYAIFEQGDVVGVR